MTHRQISIIVPALNEAGGIRECLLSLQAFRQQGHEVLLVDGGSQDDTCELAKPLVDRVLTGAGGRAAQMNLGASVAGGDILWFLHADSLALSSMAGLIQSALSAGQHWGRFDVRLFPSSPLLLLVARLMNLRSRVSGICTGDQGIFICKQVFVLVGGFPPQPLMEDVEISRRLKRVFGSPCCLNACLQTSSRRWRERGILKTILLMWRLRLAYFFGVSPESIARLYR